MIAAPVSAVSIAVSPARVVLASGQTRTLELANRGGTATVVVVHTAGFTLGLRGRMRILQRGAAVAVSPTRVVVPARGVATVTVSGRPASPGDHPSLVLLTTGRAQADVALRVRLGVVVLVRGAGRVVHRVAAERARAHGGRLELWLRNRGNVAEALRIRVLAGGRWFRDTRQLLPHARGVSILRCRARGSVRVEIAYGGSVLRRTLRVGP